jgi:hypothetical protein
VEESINTEDDRMQGDASNLVGCILTGTQLPLTTGTAWYFVMCDIIMMVQYTYYAAKDARRKRHAARQEKRARIQAAAAAAGLNLQQYNVQNAAMHTGSVWQPVSPRMPAVHSSPSAIHSLTALSQRTVTE